MRLRFYSAFLDGSRFGINLNTHALAKTAGILLFFVLIGITFINLVEGRLFSWYLTEPVGLIWKTKERWNGGHFPKRSI